MHVPEQVRIGPYVYRVEHKDDLRSDDGKKMFGQVRYETHLIELWSGIHPCRLPVTFLHEILHAIDELIEVDFSEKQISRLAPALMSFLLDNDLLREDA